MEKSQLKIHLVQFEAVPGEPLETLEKIQKLLLRTKVEKDDLLVFPEMWPSGFSFKTKQKIKIESSFCFNWIKYFAREHQCYLSGSLLEMPAIEAYNSAYLIGPEGNLLAKYRKIHLFKLTGEHRKYQPGRKIKVETTPLGNIGLAICFDLRFPEMFREMAKQEVDIILLPSAWPQARMDHFNTLLKARAIENQCFVVGVNRCGQDESGQDMGGQSVVYGPWGECVGKMGHGKSVLSLSLDLKKIQQVRQKYPFLKNRVF